MATRQMLKLDVLNFEYQAFRENQLLTHQQLNDVIEFFEDQDRLTRTCLLGVGIVCGLRISISGHHGQPYQRLRRNYGWRPAGDGSYLLTPIINHTLTSHKVPASIRCTILFFRRHWEVNNLWNFLNW